MLLNYTGHRAGKICRLRKYSLPGVFAVGSGQPLGEVFYSGMSLFAGIVEECLRKSGLSGKLRGADELSGGK